MSDKKITFTSKELKQIFQEEQQRFLENQDMQKSQIKKKLKDSLKQVEIQSQLVEDALRSMAVENKNTEPYMEILKIQEQYAEKLQEIMRDV